MTAPLTTEQETRHKLAAVILRASIAEQICNLRRSREMTQKQLAKATGTHQSAVARLEDPHGEWPSVSTLQKIASVFDVALLIHFESWSEWMKVYCGRAPVPPEPYRSGETA